MQASHECRLPTTAVIGSRLAVDWGGAMGCPKWRAGTCVDIEFVDIKRSNKFATLFQVEYDDECDGNGQLLPKFAWHGEPGNKDAGRRVRVIGSVDDKEIAPPPTAKKMKKARPRSYTKFDQTRGGAPAEEEEEEGPRVAVGDQVRIMDGPYRRRVGVVSKYIKSWMHVTLKGGEVVAVRRMHLALLGSEAEVTMMFWSTPARKRRKTAGGDAADDDGNDSDVSIMSTAPAGGYGMTTPPHAARTKAANKGATPGGGASLFTLATAAARPTATSGQLRSHAAKLSLLMPPSTSAAANKKLKSMAARGIDIRWGSSTLTAGEIAVCDNRPGQASGLHAGGWPAKRKREETTKAKEAKEQWEEEEEESISMRSTSMQGVFEFKKPRPRWAAGGALYGTNPQKPRGERRANYPDEFKLQVVHHALNLPEAARIKPTCRLYPGVEPCQLRKWIRNLETNPNFYAPGRRDSRGYARGRSYTPYPYRREEADPTVDGDVYSTHAVGAGERGRESGSACEREHVLDVDHGW